MLHVLTQKPHEVRSSITNLQVDHGLGVVEVSLPSISVVVLAQVVDQGHVLRK